ncbi:MAG: 1-acyl-sn-glycerol-3-phosphate acyltransferase [Pseudomonadota bacterium]
MVPADHPVGDRHIVDVLIEERAPHLLGDPQIRWLVKTFVYPLVRHQEAVELIDTIADFTGREMMSLAARELAFRLQITGLENVPADGRAILVANHPTGLADGVAIFDALTRVRRDFRFFVNRDGLRAVPGMVDMFIPIEWMRNRRSMGSSRATFQEVSKAMRQEELVTIFPSGRLAYMGPIGLRERDWLPTAVTLARKYKAPIVPLHVNARNSLIFYLVSQISVELRDVTLFRELLNKRRYHFGLTFGAPIDPHGLNPDPEHAVRDLQHYVERLLPLEAVGRRWDMLAPRFCRGRV